MSNNNALQSLERWLYNNVKPYRWFFNHTFHYIRVFYWDIKDFFTQPKYDVYFHRGGLCAIEPITPEGLGWMLENVHCSWWPSIVDHAILSEPSYAMDIAYAMQEDGLRLNCKLKIGG